MTMLYHYPPTTNIGKNITKKKLYQEGHANRRMMAQFTKQVERITWSHKLAANTINLTAASDYRSGIIELQIFTLHARVPKPDDKLFHFIDNIIPSPIIFEVIYDNQIQIIAAHKRQSLSNHSKVVLSNYYRSHWYHPDDRSNLPNVLTLTNLYHHIIEELLTSRINDIVNELDIEPPSEANRINHLDMPILQKIDHVEAISNLTKKITQQQKRKLKEKQFNRKTEINMQLHDLFAELKQLINPRNLP